MWNQLLAILRKCSQQQRRQHQANLLQLVLPVVLVVLLAALKRLLLRSARRAANGDETGFGVATLCQGLDWAATLLGTNRFGAIHMAHAGASICMMVLFTIQFIPLLAHSLVHERHLITFLRRTGLRLSIYLCGTAMWAVLYISLVLALIVGTGAYLNTSLLQQPEVLTHLAPLLLCWALVVAGLAAFVAQLSSSTLVVLIYGYLAAILTLVLPAVGGMRRYLSDGPLDGSSPSPSPSPFIAGLSHPLLDDPARLLLPLGFVADGIGVLFYASDSAGLFRKKAVVVHLDASTRAVVREAILGLLLSGVQGGSQTQVV